MREPSLRVSSARANVRGHEQLLFANLGRQADRRRWVVHQRRRRAVGRTTPPSIRSIPATVAGSMRTPARPSAIGTAADGAAEDLTFLPDPPRLRHG